MRAMKILGRTGLGDCLKVEDRRWGGVRETVLRSIKVDSGSLKVLLPTSVGPSSVEQSFHCFPTIYLFCIKTTISNLHSSSNFELFHLASFSVVVYNSYLFLASLAETGDNVLFFCQVQIN